MFAPGVALSSAFFVAFAPLRPWEPAPAGAAETSPGAPARTPTTPALPAPRLRGAGLVVTAAITGGLGLAANLTRIGVVQGACAAGSGPPDIAETIGDCIRDSKYYIAAGALAWTLNALAPGLAVGAGVLRGRYRAWNSTFGGRPALRSGVTIGAGAGLLGLGVLALAVAQIGLWRDLYGVRGCAAELDPTGSCIRSRWSGWLAGITFGQSAAVAGAGILALGISYRIRDRRRAWSGEWQLRPVLTRTHAGLLVEHRF